MKEWEEHSVNIFLKSLFISISVFRCHSSSYNFYLVCISILQVLDATLNKTSPVCLSIDDCWGDSTSGLCLSAAYHTYAAVAVLGCGDRCPEPSARVLSQRNTVEVHVRREML